MFSKDFNRRDMRIAIICIEIGCNHVEGCGRLVSTFCFCDVLFGVSVQHIEYTCYVFGFCFDVFEFLALAIFANGPSHLTHPSGTPSTLGIYLKL